MGAVRAPHLELVEVPEDEGMPGVVSEVSQDLALGGVLPSIGAEKLERDKAALEAILGEPDGRVAAVAKLVDDAVTSVVDLVSDVDGAIAAWLVLFHVLNIVAGPLVDALGWWWWARRGGPGVKKRRWEEGSCQIVQGLDSGFTYSHFLNGTPVSKVFVAVLIRYVNARRKNSFS